MTHSLIKWHKSGLKNPLSRARGLGSAKSGVDHWIAQRITAIANIILGGWLLWSVLANPDLVYVTGAESWLAQPINAVLMILFVISSFYHAWLGAQVIIEDYIHCEAFKIAKLVGTKLFLFAMAVACIFSILRVAL